MNQILSILVPLPDGYHHVDSIHISRMNENKYFPRVPRTAWIHLPGSLQTNTLKIRVNSYRDSCGKCLFLYFLSEILPTRGAGILLWVSQNVDLFHLLYHSTSYHRRLSLMILPLSPFKLGFSWNQRTLL